MFTVLKVIVEKNSFDWKLLSNEMTGMLFQTHYPVRYLINAEIKHKHWLNGVIYCVCCSDNCADCFSLVKKSLLTADFVSEYYA